jgi:hypothetical protein
MRRCVSLWNLLQSGDQDDLARHIRLEADEIVYDSYPSSPADERLPSPESCDRETIASATRFPHLLKLKQKDDLRPLVHAYLREEINERMSWGVIGQALPATDGSTALHLMPPSLLSALWVQFAEEITGHVPPLQCEVCKKRYRLKKGHKDRMYCSIACKMQAQRAKHKRAKQLYADGRSIEDIAGELGSKVETIRKWVSPKKEE